MVESIIQQNIHDILFGLLGGLFVFLIIPLFKGFLNRFKKDIACLKVDIKKLTECKKQEIANLHKKLEDKVHALEQNQTSAIQKVYNRLEAQKDFMNDNNLKTQEKLNNLNIMIISIKEKLDIVLSFGDNRKK